MCHIHGCYDLRLSRVMQRCWSFACQWLWDGKTALISGISSIIGCGLLLGGTVILLSRVKGEFCKETAPVDT